jgi:hypothetical protein
LTTSPSVRSSELAVPDIALRAAVWRAVPGGWRLGIGLLIILRLGLGLIGVLSLRLQSPTVIGGNWLTLIVPGSSPWSEALSMWQRWDALFYQQIAQHGYHAGDDTAAFYPLYPLLARAIAPAVGGHMVVAELVVSSAAFVAAMWLLYRIARLDAGPVAARLVVLLVAFFPVGFFLLAPYAEGLFLALSLATFWLARTGRPWTAGLVALGAALTRPQGALLILPLAFLCLQRESERGRRLPLSLLAATLPGIGLIAFTLYQKLIVGELRSNLQIEATWGYQIVAPWQALGASVAHIANTGDTSEVLNLASLVGFTLLAVWATRQLPIAYALYLWPYLAQLYARQMYLSPLMSVSRFMLVLFPCFLIAAIWLTRRPWLAAGWLVVSLALQALLLEEFVHFGFVA